MLRQLLNEGVEITRVSNQDVVVATEHHRHAVEGESVDMVKRQRANDDLFTIHHAGAHHCLGLQHISD